MGKEKTIDKNNSGSHNSFTTDLTKNEQKEYVKFYTKQFKRMNFKGGDYLTILNKSIDQYKTKEKEAEEFFEKSIKNGTIGLTWYLKHSEIEFEKRCYEFIAITFATMFLECIIWDYAAVNTSQGFTEDNLYKLSLLNKWKVVPKLVNENKKINIDGVGISLLKKLVDARNNIVHSKSRPVPNNYEELKKQEEREEKREIEIREIVDCVNRCIEGLRKIDTTNYWFFKKEGDFTIRFPTNITSQRKQQK